MTSQVKVAAHCADTKEVVVKVFNVVTDKLIEEFTLQNGESREVLIYDDRAVATHERVKVVAHGTGLEGDSSIPDSSIEVAVAE